MGDRFLSSAGAGGNCARCQTPAQYWIKTVHPWVQKFYPVLGLRSGERLVWYFQTPALYWINFSLLKEARFRTFWGERGCGSKFGGGCRSHSGPWGPKSQQKSREEVPGLLSSPDRWTDTNVDQKGGFRDPKLLNRGVEFRGPKEPQNLWTPEPGFAPYVPPLGPQLSF